MAVISRQKLIFFLMLCLVSIHGALSLDLEPLSDNCGLSTKDKTLLSIIDSALVSVVSVTPLRGFTEEFYSDKDSGVFVISRCQVNIPAENCGKCIAAAASKLREKCPYSEEATIWFTECYLHYSQNERPVAENEDQKPDLRFAPLQPSRKNIWNMEMFYKKLNVLYNKLLYSTVVETNEKRFSWGNEKVYSSLTIQGMMQCNEDYQEETCRSCIEFAKSKMKLSCKRMSSCHFIGSGCVFRFDTVPFLDSEP